MTRRSRRRHHGKPAGAPSHGPATPSSKPLTLQEWVDKDPHRLITRSQALDLVLSAVARLTQRVDALDGQNLTPMEPAP